MFNVQPARFGSQNTRAGITCVHKQRVKFGRFDKCAPRCVIGILVFKPKWTAEYERDEAARILTDPRREQKNKGGKKYFNNHVCGKFHTHDKIKFVFFIS